MECSVECGVWGGKCREGSLECKVRSVEWKESVECVVYSVEYIV